MSLFRAVFMLFLCLPVLAVGQGYPNRPIRLVVPYGPGGGADNFARPLAQQLSDQLGQQVVVENRPGAAGLIGGAYVANAAPDGYTLLCNFASLYLAPILVKNPPYDPIKNFTPVIAAATTPLVIVVHPSLPVHSMKELIDYARSHPDVSYVTAGAGTQQHLTGESLALATKTKLVHIAYKGGNQAMTDLLGGQVKMGILVLSTVQQQIESGKLRVLAVIESHRSKMAPDIPTISESGVPGFSMPDMFIGVVSPAGTPSDIVKRLNTEIQKALATPSVLKALQTMGYEPTPSSAEAFSAKAQETSAMYHRMVKDAGLKFE